MDTIKFVGLCSLMLLAAVGATEALSCGSKPAAAQVSYCRGMRPICTYPMQPMCICTHRYPRTCAWACVR